MIWNINRPTALLVVAAAFSVLACSDSDQATEVEQVEVAVLETSKGAIEISFYPDSAPMAVKNFKTHVIDGYYDGVNFHRIIQEFVIQGGDPTGTGTGGESIWGKPFPNEIDPSLRYDRRGIVGMANRGPDTNGSQFFITLAPTPWLDGKYTIFGEVVSGAYVVDAIEKVGTMSGIPAEKVVITRAYIAERPSP